MKAFVLKQHILTFILLAFLNAWANGANKTDSLRRLIPQSSHDTITVSILFQCGNQFFDGPTDSLIFYYEKALKLIDYNLLKFAKGTNPQKDRLYNALLNLRCRALIELGIENLFQSNYGRAIELYNNALEVAKELDNDDLISEIYGALGIVYKNQGRYADALYFYEQALETGKLSGDTSWIASCYLNIGNVHRRIANYEKALDYFLLAASIFEQYGETKRLAIVSISMGNLYEDQGDLDNALEYFDKALDLSFQTDDKKRICECLMNVGNIYLQNGETEKAR